MDLDILLIRCLFAAPIIISLFILRRKPLFSVRNLCLISIVFPLSIGNILWLYERVDMVNASLYTLSVKKTAFLIWLALTVMTLTVLFFDLLLKKKIKIDLYGKKIIDSLEFIEHKKVSYLRLFSILTLFTIIGVILIFTTFWHTRSIPYCNFGNSAAKYFVEQVDIYIKFRPFYVLAQHILGISGFVTLIYLLKLRKIKMLAFTGPLLLMGLFTLLLTMKRGELLASSGYTLGAILLLGKRSRLHFFVAISIIFITFYFGIALDPGAKERPFSNQICKYSESFNSGEANSVRKAYQNISHKFNKLEASETQSSSAPLPSYNLVVMSKLNNMFNKTKFAKVFRYIAGTALIETSRLFYHFEQKKSPFLKGKTYLAGILGFIPTEYFPFKERYKFGRFALRIFGDSPDAAAGPVVFSAGEAYVNFGYLGIVILSVIIGIFLWYIDDIYRYLYSRDYKKDNIISMGIVFFTMNHLVRGGFLGDSGWIQDFIVRGGILFIFFALLFYKIRLRA